MDVECPQCGGEVNEVTSSRPQRTLSSAIVKCVECCTSWHITATLRRFTNAALDLAGPQIRKVDPREFEEVAS